MKTIQIYTLENCLYCRELKGKLKEHNIPYNETIIDNGNKITQILGDNLERHYQTTTYPIVELFKEYEMSKAFISKTDLEEQGRIIIFDTIDELIIKIKQNL